MFRFKLEGTLLAAALMGAVACGSDAPEATHAPTGQPTQQASAAAGNTPPTVERVTITPSAPTASDTVQAQVKVSDADGDRAVARYTWSVNGRQVGEGPSFDLENAGRGAKVEVSVVADDGQAQSQPMTASVSLGNGEPRIESIRFEPSGTWFAGQSMAALPNAVDPDGDPLTFKYTWYVNGRRLFESGPTIDGGEFSRGDRVVLEVVASDGYADSDTLRSQEIEVANAQPQITSTPGAIGPDGFFRYQLTAEDPDGDRAFMYRLIEGPPGMDVDVLGGKVTWQPREANAGAHPIELEVDDRMGGKATQSFTLNVTFGGSPPASPN